MSKTLIGIIAALVALIALFLFLESNKVQPASGVALVDVRAPDLNAAELEGKALYDANCASCHGASGAGQKGIAPPFVHQIYRPGHHGDGAFFAAAQNGVRSHHWPFGDMPPVEGVSQEDVAKIVTYIRALQRANGIN